MKLSLSILLPVLLSGCGLSAGKFMIEPGLDGCTSLVAEKVAVAGEFTAEKITYHRVNEKCKDIQPHSLQGVGG